MLDNKGQINFALRLTRKAQGFLLRLSIMILFFSEQEEVVYDLQGRRVQGAARKGIYIVNGKKVVR